MGSRPAHLSGRRQLSKHVLVSSTARCVSCTAVPAAPPWGLLCDSKQPACSLQGVQSVSLQQCVSMAHRFSAIRRKIGVALRRFPEITTDTVALLFFEELDYVKEGQNGNIFAEQMREALPQVTAESFAIETAGEHFTFAASAECGVHRGREHRQCCMPRKPPRWGFYGERRGQGIL